MRKTMYNRCPKCHSRDLTAGEIENDGDMWVRIDCDVCDFNWVEVYTFSHNETVNAEKLDNLGCIIK